MSLVLQALAGMVVGWIIFAVAVCLPYWWFFVRRRRKRDERCANLVA